MGPQKRRTGMQTEDFNRRIAAIVKFTDEWAGGQLKTRCKGNLCRFWYRANLVFRVVCLCRSASKPLLGGDAQ